MKDNISLLLSSRKKTHGDAWIYAGYVIGMLRGPFNEFVRKCPQYSHNWVLILSKLIRILFSPYTKDHYRDIIGYATLCLDDLERNGHDNVSTATAPKQISKKRKYSNK